MSSLLDVLKAAQKLDLIQIEHNYVAKQPYQARQPEPKHSKSCAARSAKHLQTLHNNQEKQRRAAMNGLFAMLRWRLREAGFSIDKLPVNRLLLKARKAIQDLESRRNSLLERVHRLRQQRSGSQTAAVISTDDFDLSPEKPTRRRRARTRSNDSGFCDGELDSDSVSDGSSTDSCESFTEEVGSIPVTERLTDEDVTSDEVIDVEL